MQLTHLGHACLLVETGDERILLDPGTLADGWADIRDLSAVIVTHQHPDHLDVARLPALIRANPTAQVIADPGSEELLRGLGVEATIHDGSVQTVGAVSVRPVGALHAVIHEDLPRITNVGVVLEAAGEPSLFHTGDAQDGDPGRVDIVSFALSAPWQASKDMVAFLRRLDVAVAVPVHDGTVSRAGRAIYLNQAQTLGCRDRIRLLDLAGAGVTTVEV